MEIPVPGAGDVVQGVKYAGEQVVEGAAGLVDVVKKSHVPTTGEVQDAAQQVTDDSVSVFTRLLKGTGNLVISGAKRVTGLAGEKSKEVVEAAASGTKAGAHYVGHKAQDAGGAVEDWAEESSQWLMGDVPIPNKYAYGFSWGPMGPRGECSIWDCFKTVVSERRGFWWTQQWMTGWIAFALFVGVEGELFAT